LDQRKGPAQYFGDRVMIQIGTDRGDVTIDDPTKVTDAQLRRLHISRAELLRCWAEGMALMKGVKPGDRCGPVADETLDGKWVVHLVRHSPLSDPLLHGPVARRA
jgi:hypothetical protein